jgi:predicted Zn-dependent protease
LDVGWVLAGRFDEADRRAAALARREMRIYLRDAFPQFDWQFPTVARREMAATGTPAEPVDLIDYGVAERDARRWDFALVITQDELKSYFKPYTLGVPSQAVQAAVASTAQIDPEALPALPGERVEEASSERYELLGRRLYALVMHLFGHLGDLGHTDDPDDFMFAPRSIPDLDRMRGYAHDAQARLLEEMHDVADVRLEETGRYRQRRALFALRAAWKERRDILSAVAQIHPWAFPLHFSRLTTAAASTLVVLIITAEAWELGMTQPLWRVALLSGASLFGASAYLINQQRLLTRRRTPRLSEQRVVAGTAVTAAVVLGMATTYALLFGVTLGISLAFFSDALVEGWAGSATDLGWNAYLALAGFVAAVGLAIGALGASFEEQGYFRHVAFADEET